MLEIRQLVVQFATEIRLCGFERTEGELNKLGHCVVHTPLPISSGSKGLSPYRIEVGGPLGL